MKKPSLVIVAVGALEEARQDLRDIQDFEEITKSDLHLVHVYRTVHFGYGLELGTGIPLPYEEDRGALERSILKELAKVRDDILPKGHTGKITLKCLFSEDPHHALASYAEEVGADMVIMASREKKGIFESSFTQYMCKHSKAKLLVLRGQ